jgi:IS5 family transposase
MKLNLPVPDHSTLSRRRRQLEITLPVKNLSNSLHLVIDSTGVKVYGEGEWKVRQHGVGKRRTWRKLHFCTDEATREIVSVVASTNDVSDAEAMPDLLQDAPGKIEQVSADGAYDQRKCYEILNKHGAKIAIPPRKGAEIWRHANAKAERLGHMTRIYGASEKSGVKSGSGRATIIAGAWRELRSSASRRSSAIGCKLARLIINSKN